MTQEEEFHDEFEEARDYLLAHATDPSLIGALDDILHCNVRKVIRDLNSQDINWLSQYIKFQQKKGGDIDVGSAKRQIEKLLMDFPSFRSCNSDIVCLNIAKYCSQHNEGATFPIPNWVKKAPLSPALSSIPKKE